MLAAELGHDVAAVDWSEGMQAAPKEKALAAGLTIQFVLGRYCARVERCWLTCH